MDGQLFVFEGPDGCGKSTLINYLYQRYINNGTPVFRYGAPGNEPGTLGKMVYDMHHGALALIPTATATQVAHVAAHIDAIERVIAPALGAGKIVLYDRSWISTLVYGKVLGADTSVLWPAVEAEIACWRHFDVVIDKLCYVNRHPKFSGEDPKLWLKLHRQYIYTFDFELQLYSDRFVHLHDNNVPVVTHITNNSQDLAYLYHFANTSFPLRRPVDYPGINEVAAYDIECDIYPVVHPQFVIDRAETGRLQGK